MCYIAIDGGTTNTRIFLIKDGDIRDKIILGTGARDGSEALSAAVKNAVYELTERNNTAIESVRKIVASGMITSERGLYTVAHIPAPAGLTELRNNIKEVKIENIAPIPFAFIPGVKKEGKTAEDVDMMRGEETELMGIAKESYGECLYILPGSHSKIIKTDKDGRITDFTTMMTGEMINALANYTILHDTVDLSCGDIDEKTLLEGYDYCGRHGINEALFKTRVSQNLLGYNKSQSYSFFIGCILYNEIIKIIGMDTKNVVIGGRKQIKDAMTIILNNRSDKNVISLSEEEVTASTVMGMMKVINI